MKRIKSQQHNKKDNITAKSNLFTLAERDGFAVLIFPLLIFIKKIADTT